MNKARFAKTQIVSLLKEVDAKTMARLTTSIDVAREARI